MYVSVFLFLFFYYFYKILKNCDSLFTTISRIIYVTKILINNLVCDFATTLYMISCNYNTSSYDKFSNFPESEEDFGFYLAG